MPRQTTYTVKEKIRAVLFTEAHGHRACARHFDIDESMVRRWRKQKVELSKKKVASKSLHAGPEPRWNELERKVFEWIEKNRQDGIGLSGTMIRLKAKVLAKEMNAVSFNATVSWCYRFMKRHSLVIRPKTHLCQRLPDEFEEKILSFQRNVIRLREQNKYPLDHIGNMDETPLNFDMPLSRTIDKIGAKTIHIKTTGHEREHFTVALACLADGTKLGPFVIFKRKTMPKDAVPPDVIVHVHPKGWMDAAGMHMWLDKVWCARQGGRGSTPVRSCLVFDAFRAHLVENFKRRARETRTDLAVIPGGLTSQPQPLDVCLNKPFKCHIRQHWTDWIIGGNHEFTPTGRMKKLSISKVCKWVDESWKAIQTTMVAKSLKSAQFQMHWTALKMT